MWETYQLALVPGMWGDFIDFTNVDLKEKCPSQVYPDTEARWLPLWEQYTKQLNQFYRVNQGKSLLTYAYWRLGREAGEIYKGMKSDRKTRSQ